MWQDRELLGLLNPVTERPLENAFLQCVDSKERPAVGTCGYPDLGETLRCHAHLPVGPLLTVKGIPWCSGQSIMLALCFGAPRLICPVNGGILHLYLHQQWLLHVALEAMVWSPVVIKMSAARQGSLFALSSNAEELCIHQPLSFCGQRVLDFSAFNACSQKRLWGLSFWVHFIHS